MVRSGMETRSDRVVEVPVVEVRHDDEGGT